MKPKKLLASLIALTLMFSAAAGCKVKDDNKKSNDIEVTEEDLIKVTTSYLDALRTADFDAMNKLVNDFECDSSYESLYENDSVAIDLIQCAVKNTEIIDYTDFRVDDEGTTAKLKITFAYVNLVELFGASYDHYAPLEDYLDAINNCDDKREVSLKLKFVYDDVLEAWQIEDKSEDHVTALYTSNINHIPLPASMSAEDAQELFMDFLNEIASEGESTLYPEFDILTCQVYDNVTVRGEGDKTNEALTEFVKAYMSYVLSHDYEITTNESPYSLTLNGSAPSNQDLYNALCTDEFRTQYYMNFLRYEFLDMNLNAMWDDQSALMYKTLTAAIPNCQGEDYTFSATINFMDEDIKSIFGCSEIIITPERGVYEFEHSASEDDMMTCFTEAANRLYDNGEVTEDERDALISLFTPEFFGFTESNQVSPLGHPDQALGVFEQVPEFCTDGSLVYGYSNTDPNGIWMFYSKQPGWLKTVGYYVDEEGIWITNYYDRPFAAGTELIVDWWIDDELVVDTEIVTIDKDGTAVVEVHLPMDGMPQNKKYEMRLWESDHSHVISYVTLNNEHASPATFRNN